MNSFELEAHLKQAAAIAAPPRSIVQDVMSQLPLHLPAPATRPRWRHPVLVSGLTAFTGIAAVLAFVFFLAGPSVRLTLAEVQAAIQQQHWVHIHYDAGQIKDTWTNLRTGESYTTRYDGSIIYMNDKTNTVLWYWNNSGEIRQESLSSPGQPRRQWSPDNAWEEFVAPFASASTRPADGFGGSVVSARDILGGAPVIRFDNYSVDSLGQRFLYIQLWADPHTHLPLLVKTRLQTGERTENGKEWSTGNYDFPATGPSDLFALGVPDGTPIVKEMPATTLAAVQPILDAMTRNRNNFLKNYRAVVISTEPAGNIAPLGEYDIIWRDGNKVREDSHSFLPEVLQSIPPSPSADRTTADIQAAIKQQLPEITPTTLLAWAARHEPFVKQMMDGQHEYIWTSAKQANEARPHVQVWRQHAKIPLLDTNSWPEMIQWPACDWSSDFHLLDANQETPPGCLGVRHGGDGNNRIDYYIDPRNDYVCVKEIRWIKHNAEWFKQSENTLAGLHRVAGCTVAGARQTRYFDDPTKPATPHVESATITIDLAPLAPADIPPGAFDPASLTNGADVADY